MPEEVRTESKVLTHCFIYSAKEEGRREHAGAGEFCARGCPNFEPARLAAPALWPDNPWASARIAEGEPVRTRARLRMLERRPT